ncbi:MAG: ArnT family glycosyltransferase [Planctomycetota bacterium]
MNILKNILVISVVIIIISGTLFKDFYPVDEWRYVVITQELGGSFLKLKYAGDDYFEKPPFYFWILYGFSKIFGIFCFLSFKLPNILALFVFIFVFKKSLKKFVNDYLLFLVIFFILPLNFVSIQLVRMDFLMNIFINLSIILIFNSLKDDNLKPGNFFLSGLFSSVAVMIKGPAGFFIPLCVIFIILVIEKKFKASFARYFLLGFFPLILLWFVAGYIYHGGRYIESYLFKETAGRIIYGEHHRESLFYYFLLFLPVILPFSFLFALNLKYIYKTNHRIFLYWIIISVVVLSVSKSKLIIYLSSLMLPVSIIVCKILEEKGSDRTICFLYKITIVFFAILFSTILVFAYYPQILSSIFPGNTSSYIINYLTTFQAKSVVIVLILIGIFFITLKANPLIFLSWWTITIFILSMYLYYGLNKHYDLSYIVDTIKRDCKGKDVIVYKWKTLYYLKWRGKNEKIIFSSKIRQGKEVCIITSLKIYQEEKIGLKVHTELSFSRNGGIVILK